MVTSPLIPPRQKGHAPRLLIHVPPAMLNRHGQAGFGLYARIAPALRRIGLEVSFVERPSTTHLDSYTRTDFHLVHHGFLRRFNILNSGIAYIWPYWYLDPRGVLCDSSLARATPDLVSAARKADGSGGDHSIPASTFSTSPGSSSSGAKRRAMN